jgi:serine/threonine-protein kinase
MRPFRGENPIAVALAHLREQPEPLPSHVPPLVAELVARAMAKQPGDRFPDAAAMAAAARELRSALAAGAQPEAVPADGGLAALPVHPPAGVTAATGRVGLPEPRHAPGSRSRSARSAVRLVLALLVVLSLGLGARTMLGTPADEQPDVPVGTDEDAAVVLRDGDPDVDVDVQAPAYTGLPAVDVRAALAELGLVPRLAYDGSGAAVGTVSGVDPVGRLPVGSEVVLHVVPEPAPVAPAPAAPAPVDPAPAPQVPAAPDSQSDSPSRPGRGSAGGPPDTARGQSRGRGRS